MKRLWSSFWEAAGELWRLRWQCAGGAVGFGMLVLIVKWIGGE